MEQTVSLPDELLPLKDQVWQKISEIERLLLTNDPKLSGHLKAIHGVLNQYDELTHLLDDSQIREIVGGQKIVTGQVLIGKVTSASKTSITKQAKNIKVEDL